MSYVSKNYLDLREGIISSFINAITGKSKTKNIEILVRKDWPRDRQIKHIKKQKKSAQRSLAKYGYRLGKVKLILVRDENHRKTIYSRWKKEAARKRR